MNGNTVNGHILNGNTVNGNFHSSDNNDEISSQIDFTEDQESLGFDESEESDDGVSVGHPNTPVDNPEEDKSIISVESSDDGDSYSEDQDDSQFGDTESNGDGKNDIESPWSESESDHSPEPVNSQNSAQDNENQGNEDHNNDGIQVEWENLGDSALNTSTSDVTGHLGEFEGSEWEAERNAREDLSLVPRSDLMRAMIMENSRLPTGFDPGMVFDDSDSVQGPFSVPGQIWEDLSSDDLDSPMDEQLPFETFEPAPSPSPYEESSDEDKENLAPQADNQVSDNLDEGSADSLNSDGHGRINHELFGPLRPLPPWAIE